jgi:hypothetical protein
MNDYDNQRDPELEFPKRIQWRPWKHRASYIPSDPAVNLVAAIAAMFAVLAFLMAAIVLVVDLGHPTPAQMENFRHPNVSMFLVPCKLVICK